MKIRIERTESEFDLAAAWRIVAQMVMCPEGVIGLSTGRTTGNMHRLAARIHAEFPFDVSRTTVVGLDEVMGVPREFRGSCWKMLSTEIVDDLGIDAKNFLMLPVSSDDYVRDCRAFTEEIARRGGLSLLMLGVGENGHLGFNQPGSPFDSRCRVSQMHPDLEVRLRREVALPEESPMGGVTLGMADIMKAERIVLVAKGENKAGIVRQLLEGPVTESVPASILQMHPNCEVLLDSAAASLI